MGCGDAAPFPSAIPVVSANRNLVGEIGVEHMPRIERAVSFFTGTAGDVLRAIPVRASTAGRTVVESMRQHVIRANQQAFEIFDLQAGDKAVKTRNAILAAYIDLVEAG